MAMLDVESLSTVYRTEQGPLRAVDEVDLSIDSNEVYGLVGESGAGKSTVGRAIMGLVQSPGEVTSGSVEYQGEDLTELSSEEMGRIRGREIAMIFQHPNEALNPVLTVEKQLRRVLDRHFGDELSRKEATRRIVEALETVQIPNPESRLSEYPAQFSGGMNQRVMIAMAILCEPNLLIADEPTTALDVTIGAHILELLDDIREQEDLSIIYITHNMGLVAHHCDRVGIMYAGQKVEEGSVEEVFSAPKHPYTKDLLECIPRPDTGQVDRMPTIDGTMPTPIDLPDVCYYANRCEMAREMCGKADPPLERVGDPNGDHRAACFFSEEVQHE
jgi:oligopeptide/dipeptide ABC transporter ATP-binding protein